VTKTARFVSSAAGIALGPRKGDADGSCQIGVPSASNKLSGKNQLPEIFAAFEPTTMSVVALLGASIRAQSPLFSVRLAPSIG
jgi:hypothetical protein